MIETTTDRYTLGYVRARLVDWLQQEPLHARVDKFSLNEPQIARAINGQLYPGNTAIAEPNTETVLSYAQAEGICTTTFHFLIRYRFSSALAYHLIPLDQAENLQTNLLYLLARTYRNIAESIIEFIPIQQRPCNLFQKNTSDDWILVVPLDVRLKFLINALGDVTKLQPTGQLGDMNITEFRIALWRSLQPIEPSDLDNAVQDALLTFPVDIPAEGEP